MSLTLNLRRSTTRLKALVIILIVGLLYINFNNNDYSNSCYNENGEEFFSVLVSDVMTGEPIKLAQDDKRIINFIWKNKHLVPPSIEDLNLVGTLKDPSRGQSQFVRRALKHMTDGFFVEAGAMDGETRSNTLFMEKELGWTGLLVEPNPHKYEKMKTKNRYAWLSNACLATKPQPHQARFFISANSTEKVLDSQNSKGNTSVMVQCLPLFSLLSALNVTLVDYLSLDVEGSELKVLKTIPFDKVYIKTLSVQFSHTEEGKAEILKFMKTQGYRVVATVAPPKYPSANDVILVHNSIRLNL